MGFLFWRKKKNESNTVEQKEVKIEEKPVEDEVKAKAPEKGEEESKIKETNTTKKEVTTKEPSEEKEETSKKVPTSKKYHVSLRKEDGKWQVKYGGGKKAIKLFDTQAQAIKFAESRAESQDGSIVIHKKDGKIRKQDYSKKNEAKESK